MALTPASAILNTRIQRDERTSTIDSLVYRGVRGPIQVFQTTIPGGGLDINAAGNQCPTPLQLMGAAAATTAIVSSVDVKQIQAVLHLVSASAAAAVTLVAIGSNMATPAGFPAAPAVGVAFEGTSVVSANTVALTTVRATFTPSVPILAGAPFSVRISCGVANTVVGSLIINVISTQSPPI